MENDCGLLQMEKVSLFRKKKDSDELQMENYSIRLYTENDCGWLQMENVSVAAGASNEE